MGLGWPGEEVEKARKCAGLRARSTRSFGAEAELVLIFELGSLVTMVVFAGALE